MMNCLVCESLDIEIFDYKEGYKMMKCANCGLIFSNPMIPQQDYSQEITHDRWEFYIMRGYILRKFGSSLLKVFELGCGDGRFLKKLRDMGYECYGIDLNPNSISRAKNMGLVNVYVAKLDENFTSNFKEYFDVVFAFHVIEHIEDIKNVIKNIAQILKAKGLLFLSVPNPERLSKRFFIESWDNPPYHLTRWSKESLKLLLEKEGLRVLEIIEEPLTLKSAYIYIVDVREYFGRIVHRLKKIYHGGGNIVTTQQIINSEKKIIKLDNYLKKLLNLFIVASSYFLGYSIFFFLKLLKIIKVLPDSFDKGLSLIIVGGKD